MNYTELQEDLQNLIKDKKIKQADIARALDTSTSNLSQKYGNPKSEVTVSELSKILNAFKISSVTINASGSTVYNKDDLKLRSTKYTLQDLSKIWGDLVEEIQLANNFNLLRMSENSGISQDRLIEFVIDKKTPTPDEVFKIVSRFNVSSDYIFSLLKENK